mmetsp:Transcript_37374/g.111194  ORF Transcript_37374/g.111194 Transcript_37374/m.111194 type:complete len:225 (-) Transcript_37374:370-1044(-)
MLRPPPSRSSAWLLSPSRSPTPGSDGATSCSTGRRPQAARRQRRGRPRHRQRLRPRHLLQPASRAPRCAAIRSGSRGCSTRREPTMMTRRSTTPRTTGTRCRTRSQPCCARRDCRGRRRARCKSGSTLRPTKTPAASRATCPRRRPTLLSMGGGATRTTASGSCRPPSGRCRRRRCAPRQRGSGRRPRRTGLATQTSPPCGPTWWPRWRTRRAAACTRRWRSAP